MGVRELFLQNTTANSSTIAPQVGGGPTLRAVELQFTLYTCRHPPTKYVVSVTPFPLSVAYPSVLDHTLRDDLYYMHTRTTESLTEELF